MVVAEEEETPTCSHWLFCLLYLGHVSLEVEWFLELLACQTMVIAEILKDPMGIAADFDAEVLSLILASCEGVEFFCFYLDCLLP